MKKILLIATVIFLGLFGALQVVMFVARPTPVEELRIKVAGLPSIKLTAPDGSQFELETGKPLILIYFNSECDHCQRELEEVGNNMSLFSSTTLVLMSSQSQEEITQFVDKAGFKEYPNVRFGRIRPEELSERFGTLALPQIFIYSSEGNLITLFSGETKPSEIAASLR